MEGENLYHRGDGGRECLTCKTERNRGRSKDGDVRGAAVDASGGDERSGNRTSVPVLRKRKGKPVELHPVQPVRGELVSGGGHRPGPTGESHKGHRVYKSGEGWYCGDCRVSF